MYPRALLISLVAIAAASPGIPQSSLLDASTRFENEWRITRAGHFDITFTTVAPGDLERVAALADRAYRRLNTGLTHDLSLRPLIVLYGTRAELQRAIAARSFPGNREHLLWPLDTPAAQAEGDFAHELTHVFAFDIVPPAVRNLPTWLHEGLAEFERGEWTDADLAFVRDLLRTGRFPALTALPADASANAERLQQIVGHLAVDFLVARAGQDAVKRMLISVRDNRTSPVDAYLAAISLAESQFDGEFQRYVRTRFAA
jgi:hypothetical protein